MKKLRSQQRPGKTNLGRPNDYNTVLSGLVELLDAARRASARAVNSLMTGTYWENWPAHRGTRAGGAGAGRLRQAGSEPPFSRSYKALWAGGFSVDNLDRARMFHLAFPSAKKSAIPLRKSQRDDVIGWLHQIAEQFPLPWSHYTRLLRLRSTYAVEFYNAEAMRSGWTVKQLERQINSQFYERTALSRNKAAMLAIGQHQLPGDKVSAGEEVRSPLLLEFLDLKDEYSESDLEEALILHLEKFLLGLGNDFAFVCRQRRLRIGHEWFRVDLLLFHRRLRCLVLIDLKIGALVHADIGQMHLYCNSARTHWTQPGEHPPVGLILCTQQDAALARYALDGLPNKMLVREYLKVLPPESQLAGEINRARKVLMRQAGRRQRGTASTRANLCQVN